MEDFEIQGASTRRVLRQAGEVLNRELDVLYADKRDDQKTIATQNNLIDLHESEVEVLISINRDLKGQIVRDRARMNQDCWINEFTIYFAACGWIVAFAAIGYSVWVR